MSIEIELKAHVDNCEALKAILMEKAEYSFAFEKEDVYWSPKETTQTGKPDSVPVKFRLRREKRIYGDGREELRNCITYKKKEVRDGIEINDEKEFEVSAREESGRVVEEFLSLAGMEQGFSKKKKGWAFFKDGINAELLKVERLGWFLELEIISGDTNHNRDKVIAPGREKLLGFLDELGISQDRIESRFYSEMLEGEDNE